MIVWCRKKKGVRECKNSESYKKKKNQKRGKEGDNVGKEVSESEITKIIITGKVRESRG